VEELEQDIRLAKQLLSQSCDFCKHLEEFTLQNDEQFYMCKLHRFHGMDEPPCSDFSYKFN
jgi:hypothetical protein